MTRIPLRTFKVPIEGDGTHHEANERKGGIELVYSASHCDSVRVTKTGEPRYESGHPLVFVDYVARSYDTTIPLTIPERDALGGSAFLNGSVVCG
jgi:hypothetical protein